MKTQFLAALTLTASLAFMGCNDNMIDHDSADGVSLTTLRKDGHMTVEITADNFEEIANGDTPVLLDFWATWCGPCVSVAPTLEKLAEEYDGKLIIGKINIDEQKELAEKFNIGSIPAFFYIKKGEIVGDQLGSQTEETFRAKITKVFSL